MDSHLPRSHLKVGDPPYQDHTVSCFACGKTLPTAAPRLGTLNRYNPGDKYYCMCGVYQLNQQWQWICCAVYSEEDWKHEVQNGDTVLGYEEWRDHRAESQADSQPSGRTKIMVCPSVDDSGHELLIEVPAGISDVEAFDVMAAALMKVKADDPREWDAQDLIIELEKKGFKKVDTIEGPCWDGDS